ncbi:NADP-dependent oxidoreductase domain-containing protein [Pavlovales sp. CCMP2436]|nr:NADP-dependent oxidoreductase domain-containing protein [Pavlovales sp. CCMP2436]
MRSNCRKACAACALDEHADRISFAEIGLIAIRNAQLARLSAGLPTDTSLASHELELEQAPVFLLELLPAVLASLDSALAALPSSAPRPPTPPAQAALRPTASTATATLLLSDGRRMPRLGFGLWMLTGDAAYRATLLALEAGFRHLDTSENYGNEAEVGRAVRDSGIPREEIFLATKLSFAHSYGAGVHAAIKRSLVALNTTYLDLYMLHGAHADAAVLRETWQSLEAAQDRGLVRSIGVSNFGLRELAALDAIAVVPPAVVQNKHSIYRQGSSFNYAGEPLLEVLRSRGVALVAYCPLNAWPALASPLADAHVRALARELGVTPAQLLLRWAVDTGGAALTRATSRAHALENAAVLDFELPATALKRLSALYWLARAPWNRAVEPPPERSRKEEL